MWIHILPPERPHSMIVDTANGNRLIQPSNQERDKGSVVYTDSYNVHGSSNAVVLASINQNKGNVAYTRSHNVTGSLNTVLSASVNQNKGNVTYDNAYNIRGGTQNLIDGSRVDDGRRNRGSSITIRNLLNFVGGNGLRKKPPQIKDVRSSLVVEPCPVNVDPDNLIVQDPVPDHNSGLRTVAVRVIKGWFSR